LIAPNRFRRTVGLNKQHGERHSSHDDRIFILFIFYFHFTVEALFLYVITISLQVNKTATSKRLPVLTAKPAPESVSKINPGFPKPA